MKVFVAGASGAIGQRLVPRLVAGGHEVVATTRSREKLGQLRALGAEPVLLDGLDALGVAEPGEFGQIARRAAGSRGGAAVVLDASIGLGGRAGY